MKLFHGGKGSWSYPVYGYLHDAYHPEPNQLGEGRSGSGLLFRFTEKERQVARTVVHAIALDEPGQLDHWQLEVDANGYTLQSDTRKWTLQLQDDKAAAFSMISGHGRKWEVVLQNGQYHLKK